MKVKYCLPIIKDKSDQVLQIISENQKSYDYFEVWLDYIEDLDVTKFLDLEKMVFLFRRKNLENPIMDFKKRKKVMDIISGSGCYLDLNLSQKEDLEYAKSKHIPLILSYHNYTETPADSFLNGIIQNMTKFNPEIYKISTFCNTDSDALRLIDHIYPLKERGHKFIILGMGKNGTVTRIAGALLSNEMNFAPVTLKDKSAAGQLTKNDLEKILKNIKVCYIVADPAIHSLSPQIHYAAYKFLRLEKDFIFLRHRVSASNLEKFIEDIRKNDNFRGASVSTPHKVEIIKYLDEIDEVAKKIGAVNTIVKNGKKLKGYNTDYLGILNPLKQMVNLKGKKSAVIGAGGAARAAVYALTTNCAKVTIFNRDIKKAEKLACDFDCDYDSLNNIDKIPNFDIVIQATKVGMNPSDPSFIPKNLIRPNQIIFDVVYPTTKLIKIAKQRKAKTISGIEMLLFQGVEQFKLFTGKNISVDIMRKVI